MSSPAAPSPSIRSKKPVIPKVWKRPHSTIYGKNVEFGTSLYSDKIGELNGRKFNSELPWSVRNSGGSSSASSSSLAANAINNQGYLSSMMMMRDLKAVEPSDVISNCGSLMAGRLNYQSGSKLSQCSNYENLLEMTNPNRYSAKAKDKQRDSPLIRMDFHDLYETDFNNEISYLKNNSLLNNDPLLARKSVDNYLDFDYELGLFLPQTDTSSTSHQKQAHNFHPSSCSSSSSGSRFSQDELQLTKRSMDFNNNVVPFKPIKSSHLTANKLLNNKHQHCNLASSPYGQSADGRKLSLGSINPQSYRPSLPQRTTTAHASDGEEIDLYDRSSPFYTDRWAGKTIRHFDSDLYSNANLFKSMIL